jgi:hypothetical protein
MGSNSIRGKSLTLFLLCLSVSRAPFVSLCLRQRSSSSRQRPSQRTPAPPVSDPGQVRLGAKSSSEFPVFSKIAANMPILQKSYLSNRNSKQKVFYMKVYQKNV